MNRLIVMIICLTISPALLAQNLKLAGSVVSTAANNSSSASNKLSWTVGETVVGVMKTTNQVLTVGFQQNWDKIVAVEDVEYNWQILSYPNPVTDKVFVKLSNPGLAEVFIDLLNVTGSKVLSEKRRNLAVDELVTLDVSALKPGIYLLHIYSPEQKSGRVYKVIKQ